MKDESDHSSFILHPFFRLTMRTKVRRASRQAHALDGLPAARARLAGSAIDAKLLLIASLQAGTAHVVADRRAAPLDRSVQDGDQRPAQAVGLGGARVATEPGR